MEEKPAEFEELLAFFKALGNEKRLKIVGLLAQKPLCVEELAAILDLSAATVSHHLRRLVEAGLVAASAEGYYNVYSLRAETLRDSSRLAHLVQERLAAALPWENRGVMQADFIVLRGTSMPSVLLELGFLTNPDDARLLKRTDSHRAVARAVRDSVVQFWGLLRRKLARNASGGGKP